MNTEMQKTIQNQLNKIHNELVQTLVTGKATCYVNLDRMDFPPGTVDKINTLLAKRNGLFDLEEQLCQK